VIARRTFVAAVLALPLAVRAEQKCVDLTPEDIEGPFYKAGAPQRASLVEPGSSAQKIALSGTVRDTECRPLADVTLDIWHADAEGNYDNAGYRYRGTVRTDSQGRYALETNLPPPYSGRPRHIHVKLRRPGGKVLTTQLYFPGESRGADRGLVLKVQRGPEGLRASFDFVLL
jgi:protocatechuate 3,4-dioxygenase beta subunit